MRWRHGCSTDGVGRYDKIARTRRYGAALGTTWRKCRAREAGASPQARSVCCGAVDGVHERSSRDCHSSASVRWRHGWSTARVGRHGKIERACRYGATLVTTWRQCRAREAGASPQACSVCCGAVDGVHARSSRDCHSSAIVRWRHGWSTAGMRQHGKIERACRYGATLVTTWRQCRAREAGASPQARSVRCGAVDGVHARSSRDWHSSASVRWRHGWSTASVGWHGKIEHAYRVWRGSRQRKTTAPSSECVRQPRGPFQALWLNQWRSRALLT